MGNVIENWLFEDPIIAVTLRIWMLNFSSHSQVFMALALIYLPVKWL
jgi:hypothetical protein